MFRTSVNFYEIEYACEGRPLVNMILFIIRAAKAKLRQMFIYDFFLKKWASQKTSAGFHKILSQRQIKFAFLDKKPVHLLPKIKYPLAK